jgi:hypothetical protein
MKATTVYCPMSRKVSEVRRTPTAVIAVPHSIGFFGPYICISFSPTRMVATIATR